MINSEKNKKIILLIIFPLAIFIFSFVIHFYPVYKKGYPPSIAAENLILARNLTLTGEYKSQNKIGINLNSQLIKTEGDDSVEGNKLTVFLYSDIFKLFGFNQRLPIYITLILYSLSGAILFILTYKLFNFTVAMFQALIFNLLPIICYSSIYPGFYEWAILFFSLGLLFYLYPFFKSKYINLFLSGSFFALASLSRNAFLISVVLIIIYEFFKNKKIKPIIFFILPLIIGWLVLLIPDYLNDRVSSYFSHPTQRYAEYGHLFPDPYTFYFEKESFLKNYIPSGPNDLQILGYLGVPIGFKNNIKMYWSSIIDYPKEFIKIVIIGGPLIILLLFIGGRYLSSRNKDLLKLFIFWFIGLYIVLVIYKTNNWNHFLEIVFPLSLLIALGAYQIIKFIKSEGIIFTNKKFWLILFIIALIGHFIFSNKWMYHEEYMTSNMSKYKVIVDCFKQKPINQGTIAIDIHPESPSYLNYFTDQNFVYFNKETISKLLTENRLEQVFKKYNITAMIGYPDYLNQEVNRQLNIETYGSCLNNLL